MKTTLETMMPRAALLATLTFLSPVPADATLSANTEVSVGPCCGVNPIINDATPPTWSVTTSGSGTNSSGVPFSAIASALAEVPLLAAPPSAYGILKLSGTATNTGGGSAGAGSIIIINDTPTLTSPGLSGQPGVVTFGVLLTGTVAGSTKTDNNVANPFDGSAETNWQYLIMSGTTTLLQLNLDDIQRSATSSTINTQVNGVQGVDPYGFFTIPVPFTFGSGFDFSVQFNGGASANGVRDFSQEASSLDLTKSVYWGGIVSVTSSGQTITNYQLTSASGFAWDQSFVPTSSVPEPTTLALAGIVLVGLGVARRRRVH